MYTNIRPGKEWLDTDGNPIQAHGGSVMYLNDRYYWYGENKDKTTGKDKTWQDGMNYYSSKDLYNWKYEGKFLNPVGVLAPEKMADRPHIIYNKKTQNFVCWVKIMEADFTQTESIFVSQNFGGPYKLVRQGLRPLGMSGGDFDLTVAPDGKAYYYFERVHGEIICADLTDDYTNVTGYYSTHLVHAAPPEAREAPAYFERGGKHYLITSGTTGYLPNPSEVAVAKTWHGPFINLGNPHVGDESKTSFHSQISSVFKVHDKDLYIACADRWLLDAVKYNYNDYSTDVKKLMTEPQKFNYGESVLKNIDMNNTSVARYVWLPITFDGDKPQIKWYDQWNLDQFN